jgi:hypothetical protein
MGIRRASKQGTAPSDEQRRERVSRQAGPALRGAKGGNRARRGLIAIVVLGTIACISALGAGSAFADRPFDSNFSSGPPGLEIPGVETLALDDSGDVWITNQGEFGDSQSPPYPGQDGIYEFNAYPSQTFLDAPSTSTPVGELFVRLQIAVDQSNGELLVANSNPRKVDIYDETGVQTHVYSHSWTDIDSALSCFNCGTEIHIAVDNSRTPSRGRVYLSLTSPENDIQVVDADQRPVDFPATASYISNNRLTGTPSGPFGQVQAVTVDSDGDLFVADAGKGVVDEFDSNGIFLRTFPYGSVAVDPTDGNVLVGNEEFDSTGQFIETLHTGAPMAVNSSGYLYAGGEIFKPDTVVATAAYQPVSSPTTTSGTLNANVNPNGSVGITGCKFEYGEEEGNYNLGSKTCESSSSLPYLSPTEVSAKISGLTTGTTYHYRVALTTAAGPKYGTDQTYIPHKVLGLSTEEASNLTESGATLNGSFLGNGESTEYDFEWGLTTAYGHVTPKSERVGSLTEEAPSSQLTGELTPYTTYHYRIAATNGGGISYGSDQTFTTPPGTPSGEQPVSTAVHSDRALLHDQINPNGADATVHFEYVNGAEYQGSGWAHATKTSPEVGIGMSRHYQSATALVTGLTPDTLYHFRAAAANEAGSAPSPGATFTTFAFTPSFTDPCPNAHVRQQTGAAHLLDCRAYELVSATNAGGYDVESNLVAGETPFGDHPEAKSASGEPQVLYGVHDGGIPGTGDPTNHGVDPYVATRGENGWSTKYVGIPANDPFASAPFASTVLEADADLNTFAFGGSEICSPCFGTGSTETGEPIHKPNGELVQGMAGSIPQPAAKPEGFIGKDLSANGEHLVFGSTSQFEPDGNNNGDVSIYDRNLNTEETHVVSKTPGEATMTGPGIGELDISSDGSRILIGQLVSEEEGAKYWHLYMNVGDSDKTIDLTPGTTSGVLYDGMTADGSKVFFTTTDTLTGDDEDTSADIYQAEVSGSSATLTRISTGAGSGPHGPGNSDSCDPAANTKHVHWNTTGSEENCGVVAIGGGGGIASDNGTIYFLSPEKLDGSANGVQNAPNLYVARPGQTPHLVATLESSSNAPLPPLAHPFLRSFGSFRKPAGVAIDHSNGDVYVLDITGEHGGTGTVQKFDFAGRAATGFGAHGVLSVPGMEGFEGLPGQIAVDQSNDDLYVPEIHANVVQKFDSSGSHIFSIGVPEPSGVTVDQANGDLYVSSYSRSEVDVFEPDGNLLSQFPTISQPTGVAVNSAGTVYVVNGGGGSGAKGTTEIYGPSGNDLGKLDANPSYGVAVDPSDDHVYVDEGNQVSEFDSSNNPVGTAVGTGLLANSISLAADSGTLAISNPGSDNVALYGPAVLPSDPSTDNPAVIDSVNSPGTPKTADFETAPSGNYAVFLSALPLTGYNSGAHREVYRYDAATEKLECASCNPTGEQATGEATLPSEGLGLASDGRVLFNSTEGLVDHDLNETEDVYEWEPQGFELEHEHEFVPGASCETTSGCVQLISTGSSPFASSLLGVSADGADAYFFTRDKLAEQDENGNAIKIYDARSLGGFPYTPPEIQCKASDECHGAGTQAPPPPTIKTVAGTPVGNSAGSSKKTCKAGFVKKHGKCVRKPRKPKRHRKAHRHG